MRVLLVEDNPVDAQSVSDQLERLDSDVVLEHADTLTGMKAHAQSPPDVLLLDLSLPDGQGAESIRKARSLLGDVPIVVMTADDDEQRSLEMLREGAEDYLVKGKYADDTLLRALRYARERHHLKQRLAHADRLAVVGHLAAGVAHEVSNPAALVLANTAIVDDLLATLARPRSKDTSESISPDSALGECRRMVGENRAALERIRSVVRDLQGYARLERTEVEGVCLNAMVERTCNLVQSSLRHRATLECCLGELPRIAADGGKLEQLLTNLLINAGHAIESNEGPRRIVVTTTRHDENWLLLSVEDNGCGMSEEVRQRVFEPFFTTKDAELGTGLGMAIAADIARHHGGHMECQSEPDRGTRFDVWLPVDTGFALPPPKAEGLLISGLRGRVLLIDDEPEIASVYGDLIGDFHEVVVANGGRAALEILEEDADFDVVLCDLMMPELDGVNLFERVASQDGDLAKRFVFCSGGLVTQRARDFAAQMTNPLLYKPVSTEDLLAAIDRTLQAHPPGRAKRNSA
ncbi:MAG: response regulator [Myxococcales bacterium]|nr:response regulator [Myxococcales bacterium]